MAQIKNFGLVGVGSDVQFGKAGPRLKNDAGVFKFRNAADAAFVDVVAGNVTADTLKGDSGKLVVVDAAGKLVLGGLKAENLVDKAYVDAADATLQGNINTVATNLATEVSRATGVEAGLRTDLTAETNRATAAEQANATAITTEQDRAIAAESTLSGRITTEVTDRTNEITRLAGLISDEHTHHSDENAALATRIGNEETARAAADAAIRAELQSAVAGLTWEAPVDAIVASTVARDALEGLVVGSRVVVDDALSDPAVHAIFTVTAVDAQTGEATFGSGEVLVDGAAFFNKVDDAGYMFNGTSVVQFNGASAITAGAGLVKSGNTLSIVSTTGTITVTEDSIDVSQAVRDSITANATAIATERTRAETAESGLSDRIDAEHDHHTAEETAIRSEFAAADTILDGKIADEKTRAEGVESGLNTRLVTAEGKIVVLETARADHETRITDLEASVTGSTQDLQDEIDAIEAALGLESLGTKADFTSANFITANGTFKAAIESLDAALKGEETARIAAVSALDAAYKAADTSIRTDFAAADTLLSDRIATIEGHDYTADALGALAAAGTGLSYAVANGVGTFTLSSTSEGTPSTIVARDELGGAKFNGFVETNGLYVHALDDVMTGGLMFIGRDATGQLGYVKANDDVYFDVGVPGAPGTGALVFNSNTIKLGGLAAGGMLFLDADRRIATDSGVSYNSATDTLTVVGNVIAAAPTLDTHLTTKSYVDNAVSTAVAAGVQHAARGFYVAFGPGTTALPAFAGMVTRVKISVTAPGTSVEIADLVADSDVDTSVTGLYIVETAFNKTAGALNIESVGTTGVAFVEYL